MNIWFNQNSVGHEELHGIMLYCLFRPQNLSIDAPASCHTNIDIYTLEHCKGTYLEMLSDKTVDHSIDIGHTNRPSALVLMSSSIVGRDFILFTGKSLRELLQIFLIDFN